MTALIVYRIRATKLCLLRSPGSYRPGQIDAPMVVKGLSDNFFVLILVTLGKGLQIALLGCGQDREGSLRVEGKLLLGHTQQVRRGPGTADESFAGQQGCAAADYRVRPPPGLGR
jgi:hypothetical protein